MSTWKKSGNHKLKQFEEMLPLYEMLLRLAPERKHYHVQLADLLINLGRFEDAMVKITELISFDPQNATLLAMMSQCKRRVLQFDEAEKFALMALDLDEINARACAQYASISHDKREYIEAEKRWEMLLKIQRTTDFI